MPQLPSGGVGTTPDVDPMGYNSEVFLHARGMPKIAGEGGVGVLPTRVTELSAADIGLGPTLDRHYSDVSGGRRQRPTLLRHSADVGQGRHYTDVSVRRWPRLTLLRHFIRRQRATSADANIAPTQCRRQRPTLARADTQADVGVRRRPEADTAPTPLLTSE